MRLLLRGALGGALGGFVWATVAVLVSTGFRQGWWYWLTLGFLYQGLPLGMIIGVLVAAILGLLARLTQLKLGIPSRLVTGTLVATMIAWVTAWWLTKPGDFFPTPWHLDFLWIVFFGVATGGIGGVMVGNQRVSAKSFSEAKELRRG